MLPDGFAWCEPVRENNDFWNDLRGILVCFYALPRNQHAPQFLGTGFVVGATNDG